MEDKLRSYIDEIFQGSAETRKTVELKEEMLQNLTDKYKDLIAGGKTEDAAYNIAVAGVGDVSVLLRDLEREALPPDPALDAARRKSAAFKAGAIMLYILSILPVIISSEFGGRYGGLTGVVVMFIMIAAATGILIYNHAAVPRYMGGVDTVVDEFREWQTEERRRKSMRASISMALWSLIIVVYFVVSFATMWWNVSWIIFLFGIVIESIINIFFSLRK